MTDDADLIREMALAGCTGVFIGFESLSDQNLVDAARRLRAAMIMPAAWRCFIASEFR